MRKCFVALLLLIGAGTTLLIASLATAGGGSSSISAQDGLVGYEEIAAPGTISTTGNGTFSAKVSNDESEVEWTLSYDSMEGNVTQSHIHFGQRGFSGGISVFLCSNFGNGPAGTQACPPSPATVTGKFEAKDVIGPSAQGIEAGALAELVAAIRAGKAYANVHTTKWAGGEVRGQLNNPDGKP